MQSAATRLNPQNAFKERLYQCGAYPLRADGIDILQMNITRRCNMACKHCHVQAGPERTEMMNRETMMHCIHAAGSQGISTIDITGGAPEMHPDLEWLLGELAVLKKRLIVRSNLSVMLEPAYRQFIEIFAAHGVELVGSLPDYNAVRSDRQRGTGAFEQIIQAIGELNKRSFGLKAVWRSIWCTIRPERTCRDHNARLRRSIVVFCAICTAFTSTPFSVWSTVP
jgi:radical SAM/Cys-rich protein